MGTQRSKTDDSAMPRMPLEESRAALSKLWFSGSLLPFLVLVVQSTLGKFSDHLQEVWAWFIPTVLPTLSLMVAVLGSAALGEDDPRLVRKDFFHLAQKLSLAYIGLLSVTILIEPFSPLEGIKLLTASNYWLTPMQGLVVAALSVLFTTAKSRGRSEFSSSRQGK
jgi:hypothetical protein